jgi:hypothetical protein
VKHNRVQPRRIIGAAVARIYTSGMVKTVRNCSHSGAAIVQLTSVEPRAAAILLLKEDLNYRLLGSDGYRGPGLRLHALACHGYDFADSFAK